MLIAVDPAAVKRIADTRRSAHKRRGSRRGLTKNFEEIGVAGELAFEIWSGIPMDRKPRPRGDSTDFWIANRRIDIKCYTRPICLLVERAKANQDYYVLAGWRNEKEISLLGWADLETVLAAPYRDFGRGIVNYYIDAENLAPMGNLVDTIHRGNIPAPAVKRVTPERMREIMLRNGVGTDEQRDRWTRELEEIRRGSYTEKQKVDRPSYRQRRSRY
jgi:hypothetical protein